VGIAGCRWYLQINGRRNGSAAGLANSYVYPFLRDGQSPYRLARVQQFPGAHWRTVFVSPRFCLVTHCTQKRRTYGAMHNV
jgi:hypothetical protein